MGGNSVGGSSRRVTTPTTTPRERKLEKLVAELRELSPSERKSALAGLKKSGYKDLAAALQALAPAERKPTVDSRPAERKPTGGSRPAERPSRYVSGSKT